MSYPSPEKSTKNPWPAVTLADGTTIPGIGYGLADTNSESTAAAIYAGFTHLDGAPVYQTESMLGEILANRNRSELYITTKYEGAKYPGEDERYRGPPLEECKASMERMGVEYIDLYLIHAPWAVGRNVDVVKAWKEMEECVAKGLVKSIGVSNFTLKDLEALLPHTTIKPVINQIEFNPLKLKETKKLRAYMDKHQIQLSAYAPIKGNTQPEDGETGKCVHDISKRLKVDPGQVLLAWSRAKGAVPITCSTNIERIESALAAGSLEMSEEDIAAIDASADTTHSPASSEVGTLLDGIEPKRSCILQ